MAAASSAWPGRTVLDETQAQLADVLRLMNVADAETLAVERLRAAHKQLADHLDRATSTASESLRAMQARVDQKVSDASRDAELDAARAEYTKATEQAASLKAEIGSLEGSRSVTSEQVAELEAAIQAINDRLDAARAREDAAVPRLQHELGLYVNISGIKWDVKAPEGSVRGLVAPPPGQGVPGTFDLSKADLGDVGVADALWAKIDECFGS